MLVHGKKFCNFEYHNTHTCISNKCKTCLYINKLKNLTFKNALQLPLISSSDCFARNCIYILYYIVRFVIVIILDDQVFSKIDFLIIFLQLTIIKIINVSVK